jgi:hypothetical protein
MRALVSPLMRSCAARSRGASSKAMTQSHNGPSGGKSGARKGDDKRTARLRTALRENLKRRKSQARERSRTEPASHDSAGILTDNGSNGSQG